MATPDDPVTVLREGLAKLFKTEKFSDFTIVCGPETFKVHKAVLCAQSEYFHALPSFAEGAKNSINLKAIGSGDGDDDACDDPEAIRLMVHFFYYLDYRAHAMAISPVVKDSTKLLRANKSPKAACREFRRSGGISMDFGATSPASTAKPEATATVTDGNMVMHAKVFATAVKYQVSGLKGLAATNFSNALSANWNHDSFAEAAHIVYTTTPDDVRTLRDAVATTLTEHGDLLDKPEVETVVRTISGLAYELLKRSRMPKEAVAEASTFCQACYNPTTPRPCPHAGNGAVNLACRCTRACSVCGSICSAARIM